MQIFAWLIPFHLALAQPPANSPAFEVASIKPSDPNPSSPMWTGMTADAGLVRYTNMTMKDCLRAAYRVRDFQIQGPAWMKEQSVYVLGAGKNGPHLKPAAADANNPAETALGPDGRPRAAIRIEFLLAGIAIHAPAATVAVLAETISRFTARPVVDMTGVAGQHQFDVTFAPEMLRGEQWTPASADAPAPSLFEAVQEYGLKLEARKVPIEMLIVTHVEKTPTGN